MESDKDNLYARWLEGQTNPEEEAQLKASGELEELEKIIAAANRLTLPKYDASKGYKKFKTTRPSKKRSTIRRLWPALAAAASVAILIGCFWWLQQSPDYIETGNKQTLAHTFADQTTVILNDGSSIQYEEANWEATRSIQLMGEAIFNVQKGTPFIVNTIAGTVKVLGTSFNVRAWNSNLTVECYEGRVQVQYANQQVILQAGESVYGILGQLEDKQTITHQQPLWSTGNSRFYKEPVYQVFEELERQYNIKVNSPKIERPFNGSFLHNDLETALKSICKPMNLTYRISADKKVVTIGD